MESKYYEPDVEDFYVGMIYETEQDELRGIWEENTVNTIRELEELCKYNSKYIGKYSNIRVKYLDKEDVESLGFHCTGDCGVEKEFQKDYKYGWIVLQTSFDNEVTIEYEWENDTTGHTSTKTLFVGKIKNKSELKKLLIQLEIINESDKI